MDLNTITEVVRPRERDGLPAWQDGDAWLAGGTWLFSEPQPHLNRLIDLTALGWPAIEVDEQRLAHRRDLHDRAARHDCALPVEWTAAPLIGQCCRAFLASFKIWNTATVGGNICMSLPAGPMISLASALDGVVHDLAARRRRAARCRCSISSPARRRTRCSPAKFCAQIDLPARR